MKSFVNSELDNAIQLRESGSESFDNTLRSLMKQVQQVSVEGSTELLADPTTSGESSTDDTSLKREVQTIQTTGTQRKLSRTVSSVNIAPNSAPKGLSDAEKELIVGMATLKFLNMKMNLRRFGKSVKKSQEIKKEEKAEAEKDIQKEVAKMQAQQRAEEKKRSGNKPKNKKR